MTDFYVGRIQETDIILKISKGLWKQSLHNNSYDRACTQTSLKNPADNA